MITLQFGPAPRDLTPWVVGFAERTDSIVCEQAYELPMANAMIQFMLGGDYIVDGIAVGRAALWGPTARASISNTKEPAKVFMVVLTALGAAQVARSDLVALLDQRIDLEALGGRHWTTAPEQLHSADGFRDRSTVATDVLRRQFASPPAGYAKALLLADGILQHRIRGPVSALADQAGLGSRGLNKVFAREVGCGPKRLFRIARLQRVLRALHPRPWSPEAPEDALLEYSDQAHLDRDFLDLTGISRFAYSNAKRASGDQLVHTVV